MYYRNLKHVSRLSVIITDYEGSESPRLTTRRGVRNKDWTPKSEHEIRDLESQPKFNTNISVKLRTFTRKSRELSKCVTSCIIQPQLRPSWEYSFVIKWLNLAEVTM